MAKNVSGAQLKLYQKAFRQLENLCVANCNNLYDSGVTALLAGENVKLLNVENCPKLKRYNVNL